MKRLFMMSGIALVAVTCVLFIGCTQQVTEPEGPAMTQAEAQATLKELAEIADDAFIIGNAEALAELFTDDGIRYPPDAPPLVGKEAIRTAFEAVFRQYDIFLMTRVDNLIPAGEVMFARGIYEGTETPKAGGDAVEVSGYWISVMQLQEDDSWKAVVTMQTRHPPPQTIF